MADPPTVAIKIPNLYPKAKVTIHKEGYSGRTLYMVTFTGTYMGHYEFHSDALYVASQCTLEYLKANGESEL